MSKNIKKYFSSILVIILGLFSAIYIINSDKSFKNENNEVENEHFEENNHSHEKHDEHTDRKIILSEETIKKSGIKIDTVSSKELFSNLELPSEIVFNQDKVAHVVPQISGIVTSVTKSEGEYVNKGDILVTLKSRELTDLKSNYLKAVEHLELVKVKFNREKLLREKEINSIEDYQESKHEVEKSLIEVEESEQKLLSYGLNKNSINSLKTSKGKDLSTYFIRAPFSGRVIEKHVSLGEAIEENSTIFVLADLETLWVDITIYPKDLKYIQQGKKISIISNDLNIKTQGEIIYISSLIGKDTRTAKARALIKNEKGVWRSGLFVTSLIAKEKVTFSMAVKNNSIQVLSGEKNVFIKEKNVFEPKHIITGRQINEWTEVLEGINIGDEYVSENSFVLKSDLEKESAEHSH